jgi:hypothetical protein
MSAIAPLASSLPSTQRLEVHREQMVIEGHALEDVTLAGTMFGQPLGTAPVVLVVGGITAVGGNPRILRDAEVYNPRPIVPAFDPSTGDPDDPVAADLPSTPRTPGAPLDAGAECNVL